MKYLKYFEDIKIPIKVGDTLLGGRFKNKKIVVKKIGKNKKGDITINDRPLLKFRIIESVEDYIKSEYYFSELEDNGFTIDVSSYCIKIYKVDKGSEESISYNKLLEFNYDEISDSVYRFLSMDIVKTLVLYYVYRSKVSGRQIIPNETGQVGKFSFHRQVVKKPDILNNDVSIGNILEMVMVL